MEKPECYNTEVYVMDIVLLAVVWLMFNSTINVLTLSTRIEIK